MNEQFIYVGKSAGIPVFTHTIADYSYDMEHGYYCIAMFMATMGKPAISLFEYDPYFDLKYRHGQFANFAPQDTSIVLYYDGTGITYI